MVYDEHCGIVQHHLKREGIPGPEMETKWEKIDRNGWIEVFKYVLLHFLCCHTRRHTPWHTWGCMSELSHTEEFWNMYRCMPLRFVSLDVCLYVTKLMCWSYTRNHSVLWGIQCHTHFEFCMTMLYDYSFWLCKITYKILLRQRLFGMWFYNGEEVTRHTEWLLCMASLYCVWLCMPGRHTTLMKLFTRLLDRWTTANFGVCGDETKRKRRFR